MLTKYRNYEGRLALITGGSSGIGLALAKLLAREGARIWILARRRDALEQAVKSLPAAHGQKHGIVSADVTDADEVQAAVRQIKEAAGVPDVLINAAGAAHAGYVQETPLEVFHNMMDLNYFGIVNMVTMLLPSMLKRGSGYIVNFCSMGGFMAVFGYAAYTPSKYAVRGLTDSLRLELKPQGVRVSIVFPPDTDTPGMKTENETKPYETLAAFSSKLETPEKVARGVLHGMKRGRYAILPGLEANFWYRLVYLVGDAQYAIADLYLALARRQKARLERQ